MPENAGTFAPAEPYVLAAAASGVVEPIEREGGDADRIFSRAFRQWTGMALARNRRRHGRG